jgi:hypothetical protein
MASITLDQLLVSLENDPEREQLAQEIQGGSNCMGKQAFD